MGSDFITNLCPSEDGVLGWVVRVVFRGYLQDSGDGLSVIVQQVSNHLSNLCIRIARYRLYTEVEVYIYHRGLQPSRCISHVRIDRTKVYITDLYLGGNA